LDILINIGICDIKLWIFSWDLF